MLFWPIVPILLWVKGIKMEEEVSNWQELVAAELRGEDIAPHEMESLKADIPAWRDELINSLENIDKQLTARKPTETSPLGEYSKLLSWRKGALGYKAAVLERLRTVKALCIASEMSKPLVGQEILAEMKNILSELKTISKRLESQPHTGGR